MQDLAVPAAAHAAGQPGPLEPAAIPSFHGILPEPAFAAAPDGSAIAFAAYFCNGSGRLEIDRPGRGVLASWTTNGGDQFDSLSLSVHGAAVSVSGYEYAGEGPGATRATSRTRLKRATAVLQARSANSHLDGQGVITRKYGAAELSRDGKTLYACSSRGRRKVLDVYNVATRELRRTLATWAGSCSFALDDADNYALISTASGRLARLDIRTGRLTLLAGSSAPYPVSLSW